ncbi:hypothetical protein COLO4_04923 [Corchorus olitorius]|uniref:Uncharacterized protein n=1 Tax=Corchorus olitorius TaxID=93759 RepID=A0A1R3KSB6_9ROSI|nr:hypothetical protein COLO4_04923 [Corchorus olitorius]
MKVSACKATKEKFEERFKTGKNRWFHKVEDFHEMETSTLMHFDMLGTTALSEIS